MLYKWELILVLEFKKIGDLREFVLMFRENFEYTHGRHNKQNGVTYLEEYIFIH